MKDRLVDAPFAGAMNFRHIHSAIPGKVMLEMWRYLKWPPVETLIGEVDLFHSTNNNPVPQRRGIRLTTIYDLYFIRFPERTDRYGGQYFASVLPERVHQCHHVITISEAMKRELIALLDVPEAKISVIHCGLDPFYLGTCNEDELSLMELPEKFLFAAGTLEPRKNYPRLIEAFSRFSAMNGNEDYYLVIAGIDGCGSEQVYRAIDKFALSDRVLLPGYLTLEQLRCCYRRSAAFAMVSEYEGFGIPVLEAMACETPVVASTTSSFPEVVGDAGLLVDPLDVEAIAESLDMLIHDDALAANLIERGKQQITGFTWDDTASKTVGLYNSLLTGSIVSQQCQS